MSTLELHPLNDGFVWEDHAGPYRLLTDDQARQFDEQGFFLLKGAVDRDALAEVERIGDDLEIEGNRYLDRLPDKKLGIASKDEITFTGHVTAKSTALRAFAAGQPFLDLVHDLVGPDVRLYWDQLVYKKPEMAKDFPWHQDNGYKYVLPQAYLTCWTPLTPATVDNGCPWVLPGIHRRGTLAHRWSDTGFVCSDGNEGAVPVEAEPGDVVVFSSLTPHRTGPNLTDDVRKAYILQYAPEGAVWPAEDNAPCDNPDWQFKVLENGAPVPV